MPIEQLPYSEQSCEVRTTPLRAFNANVAILYVVLAIIASILAWFSSRKTGASTFDSNVYRLTGHYPDNRVTPPLSTTSMVNLTPMGSALALVGAMIVGALFHFVYAVDCRRLYTLLLVDRSNGMRWAQLAIIHTVLALIVAQLLGSTTFEFLFFTLMALPCLGILGYFADKSYPCSPCLVNVAVMGTAILLLAYWVPVITNFAYRNSDSGLRAPPYMWMALFFLAFFDILLLALPFIQSRTRASYFILEMMSAVALVVVSCTVLVSVAWALADQSTV